ncbi:AraC family transcriptional regulator [Kocuria rosea]|uniref:Helix-turn-helix domain-containing protein n=1 Tax=Kocuria rosea TaxID=1275 RepID=A0A4R5YCT7_KOCRO|nr:helix-turn-helix domain-containing protein [Kocuria rosea]TDL42841.1 helix-turn-helix domain-containing protein [Kocuria rosea]
MDPWNKAIGHIEQQLAEGAAHRSTGEIDVAALARITLTSEHHFRRMFSVLAGMPVSDYIRRRRMTIAAASVLAGAEPVQDIAVRFGYASADAFSRAFRAVHGVGPAEARRSGAVLRSQPPLRFSLSVEGTRPMDYRLQDEAAFTLVGRRRRMPLVHHGPNPAMTRFRDELGLEVLQGISALSTRFPRGVLAVSTDFAEDRADGSTFDFWFAAAADRPPEAGSAYETRELPAHRWLVLRSQSMDTEEIQHLWARAYGEWFPANPYQPLAVPELLATVLDQDGRPVHAELWLAIAPMD